MGTRRKPDFAKGANDMAGYTIVNLKEVEDRAPKFGTSPDLEARFATVPLGLRNSGISYQRFAPNFRMPFGHKHKSQEELYIVLSGSARVNIDGEVVELGALDAIRVDSEQMRGFEGGPEGAEILAFGAPKAGDSPGEDAEVTPNWWT
jgi:mannose-6-phosphate isomerase-like protein (cupin superfamily)